MLLGLQKEITELLNHRYDVLEMINLVKYTHDLSALISLLYKYHDHEFEFNQRIIILHHDTDYYQSIGPNAEGNTIFNLFTLFSNFNIACEKIIFVTNHYGIQEEINRQAIAICNSVPPAVIYTSLWYDFPTDKSIASPVVPETSITSVYCCLNGLQRQHRVLTLCYLSELGILDRGIISHSFKQ